MNTHDDQILENLTKGRGHRASLLVGTVRCRPLRAVRLPDLRSLPDCQTGPASVAPGRFRSRKWSGPLECRRNSDLPITEVTRCRQKRQVVNRGQAPFFCMAGQNRYGGVRPWCRGSHAPGVTLGRLWSRRKCLSMGRAPPGPGARSSLRVGRGGGARRRETIRSNARRGSPLKASGA